MRAPVQVREQLGVPPRIGQFLSRVERRQGPAQLGRKPVIPRVTGQLADVPLGSELGEDRLRRPRGHLRFGVPAGLAQEHGQIPRRLGQELRPPVHLGPLDYLAERAFGGGDVPLGHPHQRHDAQILGVADRIGHVAAQLADLVQVAPRRLQVAAVDVDLRPPPERQRPEGLIPGRRGLQGGAVGLRQRAVERPLLPIRNPEVVVALGDALTPAGPLEGGNGDRPGPDRLRVPPPQVADDPQIVGAAAGRRKIAVQAGDHEGARAVVRRLVDPPADQGHGPPRVERAALDSLLAPLVRLLQRDIQPPQPLVMATQPRLRRAEQQGQGRRVLEVVLRLRPEVLDNLGVASGRGEALGLVDYE